MSLQNAIANLEEFSKELGITLVFDANNTCVIAVGEAFSCHLTYEQGSAYLYIYAPLLDGLPTDPAVRLSLYELLLESSLLGGQVAGGGVGLAKEEQLILIHAYIPMGIGTDASALRRFAPLFIHTVEVLRNKIRSLCDGVPYVAPPSMFEDNSGAQKTGGSSDAPPPGFSNPGSFIRV